MIQLDNYKTVFIAGTDTHCGKTTVTALCANVLQQKKKQVETQKWVQTGSKGLSDDLIRHDHFLNRPLSYTQKTHTIRNPYCFETPVSPHFAAKIERKTMSIGYIQKQLNTLLTHHEIILIEGSGGCLVPVSETETLLDWVKRLKLPVLLVTENKVGCLNHTLLTVATLKDQSIHCLGIIPTQINPELPVSWLKNNVITLRKFTGLPVCDTLPFEINPQQSLSILEDFLQ